MLIQHIKYINLLKKNFFYVSFFLSISIYGKFKQFVNI